MSSTAKSISLFILSISLQSSILRHDVPDEKFIDLAKQYPQICHLPMGEATLIDSCWVITAGHIGVDLVKDIEKGFSPSVKCNGKDYKIEKVIVHPGFKPIEDGLQNDIALIRIYGSVRDIFPAQIYDKTDESGKQITIVGMGDVGNGLTGPQKWDKITRAATNIVDGVNENWLYFTFDAPDSGKATELEGISGPGDSGGPAFTDIDGKRFILGISSNQTGRDKFGKGRYGVTEYYTRVSSYYSWITKTTKKDIR